MPFFSVIIPTYNRSKFILHTLNSVFQQTFQDFEVIVVDDCSTDNTEEILKSYIDNHKIRYIKHDKNYERAQSRNTGMSEAKGEFLTFLDSDDFMYENCLQDAFEYAQTHKDCHFFHNLYDLVDEKKQVIKRYSFPPLKNPLKSIAEGNFLSCIGVFLHKDIYTQITWDNNPILSGSEDYDFWLRVIAHTRHIGRIEKYNNAILHHEQRSVNTAQLQKIEQRFQYFVNKIYNDEDYKPYQKYQKRIEATLWIFLALTAKENKEKKICWKYTFKSIQLDYKIIFKRNCLSLLAYLFFGKNKKF
jgi:glycosyltransferase involved in cell wall biosynthesis